MTDNTATTTATTGADALALSDDATGIGGVALNAIPNDDSSIRRGELFVD